MHKHWREGMKVLVGLDRVAIEGAIPKEGAEAMKSERKEAEAGMMRGERGIIRGITGEMIGRRIEETREEMKEIAEMNRGIKMLLKL